MAREQKKAKRVEVDPSPTDWAPESGEHVEAEPRQRKQDKSQDRENDKKTVRQDLQEETE